MRKIAVKKDLVLVIHQRYVRKTVDKIRTHAIQKTDGGGGRGSIRLVVGLLMVS